MAKATIINNLTNSIFQKTTKVLLKKEIDILQLHGQINRSTPPTTLMYKGTTLYPNMSVPFPVDNSKTEQLHSSLYELGDEYIMLADTYKNNRTRVKGYLSRILSRCKSMSDIIYILGEDLLENNPRLLKAIESYFSIYGATSDPSLVDMSLSKDKADSIINREKPYNDLIKEILIKELLL